MKKRNKITLKGKSNWRTIGTLMVITICLVSVMSPAMPQSSFSLFNNASNATDGETEDTPDPTPVPSPSPTQSPSPGPSPAPSPSPSPLPTPTPGPTPILTPSPSSTPSPAPTTPPTITSFAPPSPVYDTEEASRTFNISIDHAVNVSWVLNGTEVFNQSNVTESAYTNTSAAIGIWNVTIMATNENGTVSRTWIWNVSQQVTPTPSPITSPIPSPIPTPCPTSSPSPLTTPTPTHILASDVTPPPTSFFIYGWVDYKNGNESYNSTVNITNINTSMSREAESSADYNYFQLFDFMNVSEGNLLVFNVSDGTQFNVTNYNVTRANITKGGIFGINLTLETPPQTDYSVLNLWSDPENPLFGDIVNVTARIGNKGTGANSTAVFYDEHNFTLYRNISNPHNNANDTITQPDALKIRLHFVDFHILGNGSYIKIYNASDNLIHNFTTNRTDFWTNWSIGERIRIQSHATEHVYFSIDKYEAVFANEPVTLGCGQLKNFTAKWNASAWLNDIQDIASGNHTILVNVTPVANESNTENNHKSIVVAVKPLTDLELTNVSLDKTPLLDGDLVNVTATIINNGSRDAFNFKVVFLDNALGEDEGNTSLSGVVFNETIISMLGAGNVTNVHTTWNASFGYHTITAIVDPDGSIREFNETNNQSCISVYVNESRDFAITALSLSYTGGNESCDPDNLFLYEQVTINATLEIINLANRGGEVDVGLYLNLNSNATLLNLSSVVFEPGNGTYYAPFEWEVNATAAGNHTLKVCADYNNTITEFNETNNTRSMEITVRKGHDFAVTNLAFDLTEPVIGDVVKINATIANTGVKNGTTTVEFYDNKGIEIKRTEDDYFWNEKINDNLTLPGTLGIRVHFSYIEYGAFTIYDKNDTKVEEFGVDIGGITDKWTKWASGDTIRIESEWANFTIDRYEAVLANTSISLDAENSTDLPPIEWNLSQEFGWTIAGEHNITVKVDPYNQIAELNEANNAKNQIKVVNPSLDFTVINVSFTTQPLLDHTARLNATVANHGVRNGTATLRAYCDEIIVNETELLLNFTDTPRIVNMSWVANITNGGVGHHNLSVKIDPGNVFAELDETNNTQSEQIFVNGTDLAITDLDTPCTCFENRTVPINVTIANMGALNATNFTLYLRIGIGEENTTGSVFFNNTFPGLNSGESRSITVYWTPEEWAYYTITASIPHNYTDNDKANNEKWKGVPVYAKYEFAVDTVNVYPDEVQEGENVVIVAKIRNLGRENGSVNVSFYVNRTDFAGSRDDRYIEIGRAKKPVYVEVGNTTITSIPWRANITGGDHFIYAVVNPDNDLTEWPCPTHTHGKTIILKNQTSAENNVKNCSLRVIKPDLKIKALSLDPPKPAEGDLVTVTANVRNEGIENASSTIRFYMEEKGEGEILPCMPHDGPPRTVAVVGKLSRPENMTVRVHFDYIDISINWHYHLFWSGYDDIVRADMDGQPVDFYVKNDDVEEGQPIKVAQIDFNTTCSRCTGHNTQEEELICSDKRWEDVWTEWSNGKNFEVVVDAITCYDMGMFIDKYQVRLGNRTITLNAGEGMPYNVTWNTSSLEPGVNYTLVANVEDKVKRNETFLGATDLAVTNLSVEKEVLDGNQGWINATIENVGRKNATDFKVNISVIYEPEKKPSDLCNYDRPPFVHSKEFEIERLSANESWSKNISWNASINEIEFKNARCCRSCAKHTGCRDCPWSEIAENYTVKVEIIPLENIEVEKGNNAKRERVQVKRSRDFEVTNLVINETRVPSHSRVNLTLGENVTLNATFNITNLASRGDTVNVGFYIDEIDTEHEIGNISTNFTNFTINETKSVKLENWTVWNFREVNIAGDHNMTVVVDPGNKIHELNELNNEYVQKIHVIAPELTVTRIRFDPELPGAGDNVTINVTIANYGDMNATDVALAIYDRADRHIENVAGLEAYCGFPKIEVKRKNATAMRLYLDLDIEGGVVCIQNSTGKQIRCYNDSFHGWTPWMLENNTAVVTNGDAYAKVSKIYYILEESSEIGRRTIPVIEYNKTATGIVNWTAYERPVGERLITAIINPGIDIAEYDESNNTLTSYMSVQTADLIVSNLAVRFNDTKLKHGDVVNITANVTNAGVDNATDFDVRFFVDDILIEKYSGEDLMVGEPPRAFVANWTAIVGEHVIKVEADYDNVLNETNETNNIEAQDKIYVHGAEVSGNESWKSLGLHCEILFDNKTQLYDEDEVNITVNITNFGCLNATNFNVLLFYDYSPYRWETRLGSSAGGGWKNKTYPGADRVYLWIIDRAKKDNCYDPMDAGDIEIYDARGNAVLNETNFNSTCNWTQVMEGKSCWITVEGDTANVSVYGETYETFTISFYPVYQNETSKLFPVIEVPVNGSYNNVSMKRNVSVGDFTVMAVIDPENRVPEDNKADNVVLRTMHVKATKDFTVTEIIPERSDLLDADVINITANVSNVGYRNGTTKVRFVYYKNETRIHKYYFNKGLNLSEYNLPYLPISPNETITSLQPYRDLVIIHRPGVDAIRLNYDWHVYGGFESESGQQIPAGEIWICNETGEIWRASYWKTKPEPIDWIQGDMAYIHTLNADFYFRGYTTKKEFHEEENVMLNASVTWDESGNITAMWSEPKNITTRWTASPGDHNITVTIDPDDEISEMNETNNTYVLPFPLSVNATKDPEIIDLNISPRNPRNGDSVTITAVVHNNGTATANFSVDLWMDTLKDSSAAPVPHDWNITVGGKTRYITLLNHTELSLAPGESKPVNAAWESISVYGNPTYIVRAIVPPRDEINESNNEMNKEVIMDYPDLMVAGFNAPTRELKNASVNIKNIGGDDASNVTVLLELTRHKKIVPGYTGILDIENTTALSITEEGASRIKVHFDELDVTREKAFLVICDKEDETVEYYGGEEEPLRNLWSPWVTGDTILIYYCGANFYIDECKWGDVYMTAINLNVSESVNVSLPESPKNWNKYEGVAFLNATVDPDDEKMEQQEDNNNKNTWIYVDLVLKEIKTEKNRIIPVIWSNDTVENGMPFPACNFSVSLEAEYNSSYETIQTKWFNETIYGGEERGDVWFDIYECLDRYYFEANNKSKIMVKVDSEDEIKEWNEGNNEKKKEIGPDIEMEGIDVWPDYPVVGRHNCSINVTLRNNGCLPAEGFDVNCSLNITYLNAMGGIGHDNITLLSEDFSLDLNGTENGRGILTFEWKPPGVYATHLPYYDVYKIRFVADTGNDVVELDETNNEDVKETPWRIYTETGYDANHPLEETCAHNTEPINCGVSYTIGDSYYLGGGDPLDNSTIPYYGPVHFNNVYPEGATPIFARLYLYWTGGYEMVADPLRPWGTMRSPTPLDVNVTFNGRLLGEPKNYTDRIFATTYDFGYGVYAYNVSNIGRNNTMYATRKAPANVTWVSAIAGMGLLVIYEKDDLPLTTYWINEGADVLWSSNMSGLTADECTTHALFNGTADLDRVNATLRTIVPFGDKGIDDKNSLFFNTKGKWHGVWTGTDKWPPGDDTRYVTDYLKWQDNEARLQDRGDFIMPSNAFLILTYPPDLVPWVKTDLSATAGKEYEIPVVINNIGLSNASGFTASVYVDEVHEKTVNITEISSGGSNTDLTFTRKAPLTEQVLSFNVTVKVDTKDNVTELINDQHPDGETNNNETWTVTVVVKPPGWDLRKVGGGGPGPRTVPGTGPVEGGIEGEGATAGGSGGGAVGEFKGKKITGYLMKGDVASSGAAGGGGGGKGEFSLVGLLIRIAMLVAAGALVGIGYLHERRRQNNKLSLEKKA